MKQSLVCHGKRLAPAKVVFEYHIDANELQFQFEVHGELEQLVLPAKEKKPRRVVGLWERSCFEFFLRASGHETPYLEFNLSPAGHWNAFLLKEYRGKLREEGQIKDLAIRSEKTNQEHYSLLGRLKISELPYMFRTHDLSVNVCAILETTKKHKFYYALSHPDNGPNFHHPDSFKLTLPNPHLLKK